MLWLVPMIGIFGVAAYFAQKNTLQQVQKR